MGGERGCGAGHRVCRSRCGRWACLSSRGARAAHAGGCVWAAQAAAVPKRCCYRAACDSAALVLGCARSCARVGNGVPGRRLKRRCLAARRWRQRRAGPSSLHAAAAQRAVGPAPVPGAVAAAAWAHGDRGRRRAELRRGGRRAPWHRAGGGGAWRSRRPACSCWGPAGRAGTGRAAASACARSKCRWVRLSWASWAWPRSRSGRIGA